MSDKRIISLQLGQDLCDKIQIEANKNFRTISAQIRLILTEYFNKQENE